METKKLFLTPIVLYLLVMPFAIFLFEVAIREAGDLHGIRDWKEFDVSNWGWGGFFALAAGLYCWGLGIGKDHGREHEERKKRYVFVVFALLLVPLGLFVGLVVAGIGAIPFALVVNLGVRPDPKAFESAVWVGSFLYALPVGGLAGFVWALSTPNEERTSFKPGLYLGLAVTGILTLWQVSGSYGAKSFVPAFVSALLVGAPVAWLTLEATNWRESRKIWPGIMVGGLVTLILAGIEMAGIAGMSPGDRIIGAMAYAGAGVGSGIGLFGAWFFQEFCIEE